MPTLSDFTATTLTGEEQPLSAYAGKVALVVNTGPRHDSASVFTANRCQANPVLWSKEAVKDGVVRAVVLNSGGANCYTGPDGFATTHAVAERVAAELIERLPRSPEEFQAFIERGYAIAQRMSWDAVAREYVVPGIQRATRANRLKQIA